MMDLLDTTAFSAAMRNEAEMVEYLGARRPGTVGVAPPVLAEIEYGLRRLDRNSRARTLLKAQKDRLLGHVRIIAIAAIARSHAARVITANLVHFRRIEGLDSHHWTED